jgi:hypothetical protein
VQNSVVAAINGGNLQVVYLGPDLLPRLAWQNNKGEWFGYNTSIFSSEGILPNGGPLSSICMGVTSGSQIQVIAIGAIDQLPYVVMQDAQGNWSFTGALDSNLYNSADTKSIDCYGSACGVASDGTLRLFVLNTPFPYTSNIAAYFWNNTPEIAGIPPNWWFTEQSDPNSPSTSIYVNDPAAPDLDAEFIIPVTGLGYELAMVGMGQDPQFQPPLPNASPYIVTFNGGGGAGGGGGWSYAPLPALPVPYNGKNFFTAASCPATQGSLAGNIVLICLSKDDGLPYCFLESASGAWAFLGQLMQGLPNAPAKLAFNSITMAENNAGALQIVAISGGNLCLIYTNPTIHAADDDLLSIFFWYGLIQPKGMPNIQFKSVCATVGADGNLWLIALGYKDSLPYGIWQDKNNNWNWHGQLPQ